MSFYTLLIALFVGLSVAGYTLEDDYLADGNFFDLFSFFTATDPTAGFVDYVDQSTASSNGYINASSSNVYIGTDSVNVAGSGGRESVRITSNKAYNSGLVILDLEHMPGGACGTWPAFWMVGPNWPNGGEIDIIEGVNQQSSNDMTLHTADGCTITNNNAFSGTITTDNCYVDASGQSTNAGCQITTSNTQTYGSGFNSNNGGVYAVDYTSSAISIYFFPRGSIPSDISSGSPDPSGWSTPLAQFQGGCDIDSMIYSQQIVFDLTYCGSWAGNVWSSGSCASKADTCNDYVQNNPTAFQDSYWSINSLKVYQPDTTSSKVVSTTAWTSSSVWASIAEPTSSYVSIAEVNTSSISPTTFAVSMKSAPILSTGVPNTPTALNATSTSYAGNATTATYPTGSGTALASIISATGAYGSVSAIVTSSSYMASSAPSSPPEVTPSSSSAAESTVIPASTTDAATQSYDHTWSWQSHEHRHRPTAAAVKRHLRYHKRHGAGRH